MANMFVKAKAEANIDVTPAKGKKPTIEEFFIDGLQDLAAVDAAIKSLTTIQSTLSAEVKEQMVDKFVDDGMLTRSKPKNFRGIDEMASASCEIKKRSSRSTLSQDEVDLFKEHGIPFDVVSDVPNLYVINAKYKNDDKLLAKVSKALKGIVPDDFIKMQVGNKRHVTTAKSIDKMFECDLPKDQLAMLLKIVSTLSVKPKYEGDIKDAINLGLNLVT